MVTGLSGMKICSWILAWLRFLRFVPIMFPIAPRIICIYIHKAFGTNHLFSNQPDEMEAYPKTWKTEWLRAKTNQSAQDYILFFCIYFGPVSPAPYMTKSLCIRNVFLFFLLALAQIIVGCCSFAPVTSSQLIFLNKSQNQRVRCRSCYQSRSSQAWDHDGTKVSSCACSRERLPVAGSRTWLLSRSRAGEICTDINSVFPQNPWPNTSMASNMPHFHINFAAGRPQDMSFYLHSLQIVGSQGFISFINWFLFHSFHLDLYRTEYLFLLIFDSHKPWLYSDDPISSKIFLHWKSGSCWLRIPQVGPRCLSKMDILGVWRFLLLLWRQFWRRYRFGLCLCSNDSFVPAALRVKLYRRSLLPKSESEENEGESRLQFNYFIVFDFMMTFLNYQIEKNKKR
mgnify:CR=1 FL=1